MIIYFKNILIEGMPGGNSSRKNRTLTFKPSVTKRIHYGNRVNNQRMFLLRPHNKGYKETRGKFKRALPLWSPVRNTMAEYNESNPNNRVDPYRNYSRAYNNNQAKLAANALHEELLQNEPDNTVNTVNPLRNAFTLRKVDTLSDKIDNLKQHIKNNKINWAKLIPQKKRILASSFGIKINEYINTNSTILGQNLNTRLTGGGGKTKKRKY